MPDRLHPLTCRCAVCSAARRRLPPPPAPHDVPEAGENDMAVALFLFFIAMMIVLSILRHGAPGWMA